MMGAIFISLTVTNVLLTIIIIILTDLIGEEK
jgi:hypothetical protein